MTDEKWAGFPIGLRDTRADARERKTAKRAAKEDPAHLKFVRKQRCLVAGKVGKTGRVHRCKGQGQAHHEPPRGKRTQWSDRRTVKLCAEAHRERHNIGKTRFERRYGVDIEAEAKRLDELDR